MRFVKRPRSFRRVTLFSFLMVVGLAGLFADFLVLGPTAPADLPPVHLAHTLPNTDLNPFGVNTFLDQEVEEVKKRWTMEMISDAGIGWIKQEFSWAEIEPRQGHYYDDLYGKSTWEKFDQIVDLAEEYGIQVIARLDRPPQWARSDCPNPASPPKDARAYANFVYQFVLHYRGRIHYIQIWNEPNLDREWCQGAAVDARAYTQLLHMAYQKAKEADPNIQVLSAPLAVNTTDDPNRLYVSELTYLEEMYQAGAGNYFDIMSANAYGFDDPPEDPPSPDKLNFRRVELLRLIMERHGDGGKAIWFNEYGWDAPPADMPESEIIWGRVTEEQQAQWTVEGIRYAEEHWPWAGVFSIWYFRPVRDPLEKKADYYFRMVNADFTPAPVYLAVKEATALSSIASPGLYDETAAPVQPGSQWQLVYTSTITSGSYLESSEPNSSLGLIFEGTDLTLRVRRGPDGGRLLVRVDGIPGKGTSLPQAAFGQTYLELYSAQPGWMDVHLIQGLGQELGPAKHRLELTVAADKAAESTGHSCAVDSFRIEYNRSYHLFWASAGSLAILALAMLVALAFEVRRPLPPRQVNAARNPWTLRPEQLQDAEKAESAERAETAEKIGVAESAERAEAAEKIGVAESAERAETAEKIGDAERIGVTRDA